MSREKELKLLREGKIKSFNVLEPYGIRIPNKLTELYPHISPEVFFRTYKEMFGEFPREEELFRYIGFLLPLKMKIHEGVFYHYDERTHTLYIPKTRAEELYKKARRQLMLRRRVRDARDFLYIMWSRTPLVSAPLSLVLNKYGNPIHGLVAAASAIATTTYQIYRYAKHGELPIKTDIDEAIKIIKERHKREEEYLREAGLTIKALLDALRDDHVRRGIERAAKGVLDNYT